MKIVLGGVPMSTVDAPQVKYKGTTSDPVPTASIAIKDDTSSLQVAALQELLILDEHVTPNPTINFLLNPSLNPYSTNWINSSRAGVTLSQQTGGGVIFTASNTAPGTACLVGQFTPGGTFQGASSPLGLIVPGQSYVYSVYAQATSPVHIGVEFQASWWDIGGNFLFNTLYNVAVLAPTSLTRYSIIITAPANAEAVQVTFGLNVTNPINSGSVTFTQAQLEPMWFPTTMTYPSPWVGPSQTNCVQLPSGYYIRQYRKFAGLVTHALARDYVGNARTWYIDASGYAWLFSLTFTTNSFTNTNDKSIITSLISTYWPAGANGFTLFGTGNIIQGASISSLQPNWDDLRSIFDTLAAQAGFFWTVDPYWQVLYQPPGFTQMPISLIADDTIAPDMSTIFPVYDWQAEMDFTQPGASILVLGGQCSSQLTLPLTSGNNYPTFAVQALPAPITAPQLMTIGGTQQFTCSVNAPAGATTISVQNAANNANFTATQNYGAGTSITTNQYVSNVVDPVNGNLYSNQGAYGYGVNGFTFMRKLTDNSLQSQNDVTARGVAELLQYDQTRAIYHGMTNVELLPGQAIQVTSNTDGLNAQSLLVQQVQASWLGTSELLQDTWEYIVDLGATNRATTAILSHLHRITSKSQAAPAISQTAIVVMERFGVHDGTASAAATRPGVYGSAVYGYAVDEYS